MATEYRLSHTASEIDRKLSEIDNLGKVKSVNGVEPDENGNVVIEVGNGSGQNVTIEPADDDIPKVFITGAKPTTKDDVLAEMQYISKTDKFHAYLEIKCQGTSSMSYAKKNFTVKLYSDEARETKLKKRFKGWNHNGNKYVLKANFIDHSHARNIVCARLWNEVVASRPDYDSLPEEMRNSPRNGAVDGFPIKVYYNGTYEGIYTWNIGKDDWMWGMDEDNPNHILLCAETNTDGVFRATPCNFRALWSGVDETDWSVEVGTNSTALKTSLNNLIQFVMDNNGDDFRNGIGNYLDIQSAIDYYIFQYEVCGLDGLAKNMLLATYDGTVWRCGAYDLDSSFGLWWNGTKLVPATYACPEDYQEEFSLLWERIEANFLPELKARQAELRKTVLSYSNIVTHFERFMDVIGLDLYAEDLTIYTGIPSGSTNNIKQIRNFIRARQAYVDAEFAAMSDPVACTGIALSAETLTFTAEGTQTLTATVTPDGCTDVVTWESTDSTIASVSGGEVTARANGSATITAKCGEYSASCAVAVSGIDADGGGAGDENGGEIDYTLDALDGVEWLENKTYSKSTGELVAADGEYAAANKVSLQANARYALENNSGGTWPAFFLFDQDEAFIFTAEANIANGIPYNFAVRDGMMASVKVFAGGEPIDVENLTLKPVDNRASATGYKNVVLSEYQWTENTEGKLECMIADFPNATSYAFNFDALVFNAGFDNTANADVFALNLYNENYYLVYLGKRTHDEFNTWVEENGVYLELNPHLKP